MANKNYRITKGIPKSIKNKNKESKTLCRTRDLTKRKKIEREFKTNKNNLLKVGLSRPR